MMDAGTFREHMVDQIIGSGRLRSEPLVEALRAVPRHVFVPGVELAKAYEDAAIVTKWAGDGQPISSSSQPAVMAAMLEQLGVEPGQRVLEIGAGTGYNAAVMAHLVGESGAVTTLDIDQDLVDGARRHLSAAGIEGVTVVCADGANGWSEACPYDRIILTVGAWDLSPAWIDQLAGGGRLVLPLSVRGGLYVSVTTSRACRSSAVGSCLSAARSPPRTRSVRSATGLGCSSNSTTSDLSTSRRCPAHCVSPARRWPRE